MQIKILSWNIFNKNINYELIIKLLLDSHADIICLQEVSIEMLDQLKMIDGYSISTGIDFYESKIPFYLVTLIKTSFISQSHVIPLNINPNESEQGYKFNWIEGIEAMYSDMDLNNMKIRIYNIHLSAGCGPHVRKEELDRCLQTIDNSFVNILCGDFNTSANPMINFFFGHLFNFSFKDYFINERRMLIKELSKYGLRSIFHKETTENAEFISKPISIKYPLIADYIITTKSIKVHNKQIYANSLGSDHRALECKVTF